MYTRPIKKSGFPVKREDNIADGGVDNGRLLRGPLACARCDAPLDRDTLRLDGEYDLVCGECYLLTATDPVIAAAQRRVRQESNSRASA